MIENICFFHPSILSNKKYIHFCVLTCKSKKEYWDVGKIIISYLMGCSQIKDPNLDIYMEVDKQFYMGGDMVRGCVHINAKSDSMYEKLVVRLEGQEYVYWEESAGQESHIYENTYKNYDSIFTLFDFHGVVNTGQYSFPFAFLLPFSLPGSFVHNSINFSQDAHSYIKYTLTATLNHGSSTKKSQQYEVNLNIEEPLRAPIGEIQNCTTTSSHCCGCLYSYGDTRIRVWLDRNLVRNGDALVIRGEIENKSSTEITETQISLLEKRIMISRDMVVEKSTGEEIMLGKVKTVRPRQSESFQISAHIPRNFTSYTAIGRIAARYFVIRAQTNMGCCMCEDMPYGDVHILLQSTTPKILCNRPVAAPDKWEPQQMPLFSWGNMNRFLYQPCPGMEFTNQPTISPMMQQQGMMGKYPPMEDNISYSQEQSRGQRENI